VDRLVAQMGPRILELGGLPTAAKAGLGAILVGLVADATVHALGVVTAGSLAALVVEAHLAHLLVLVGMVITLAGVVVDGVRGGRLDRPGRRSSHAVR
jgi:hypothetical protein